MPKYSLSIRILAHAALFILLLAGLIILLPDLPAHELSTDEGINAMKAFLTLKGYSLFDQIWSDQPPLFTLLLAGCFKIFGISLSTGRMLILFFSAFLCWTLFQLVRHQRNILCGFAALIFLLLSNDYLLCSMKILIGIPALSFALLSLYFLILLPKAKPYHFILPSAVFMALAAHTKLFVLTLIPAVLIELVRTFWPSEQNKFCSRRQVISAPLVWVSVSFAAFLFIAFFISPALFSSDGLQLIRPHQQLAAEQWGLQWEEIHEMMVNDYDFLFLAIFGVICMWRKRNFDFMLPLIWFLTAFFVLLRHRPLWHHHYLLLSLPLVWLAALAVDEIKSILSRKPGTLQNSSGGHSISIMFRTAAIALLFLAVGYGMSHFPEKWDNLRDRFPDYKMLIDPEVTQKMSAFRQDTHWVITDRPVYPFYLQLPVPPELAVPSAKRRNAGMFSDDYFLKLIEQYHPEQIIIGRFFSLSDLVRHELDGTYTQLPLTNENMHLFIRRDIVHNRE